MALDTVNNLISLAAFKLYIGQSTGSTSYEERYIDIINEVSWRFNDYTGRLLKARATTEYYDGDGSDTLWTRNWPINSNSTSIDIRVDSERNYDTGDKIDSTSIIIWSTKGKIKLDGSAFDEGDQSVKISLNVGYSTIPHDLAYAAKEMCRVTWRREQTNQIGIKSESVEGGSVTFEPDLPRSIWRILESYKKRDDF